jgi:hypothetical protein
MLTSGERTLRASQAAYMKHATHDPAFAAERGQAGLLERFRREVVEHTPGLPEAEIERRVEARRRSHMVGLSLLASRARARNRQDRQQQVEQ